MEEAFREHCSEVDRLKHEIHILSDENSQLRIADQNRIKELNDIRTFLRIFFKFFAIRDEMFEIRAAKLIEGLKELQYHTAALEQDSELSAFIRDFTAHIERAVEYSKRNKK
jgi:hypothetical protein